MNSGDVVKFAPARQSPDAESPKGNAGAPKTRH